MKSIVLSLILICITSAVLAIPFQVFSSAFIIAFGLQIVLFSSIEIAARYTASLKLKQLQIQQIEEYRKISYAVACPCHIKNVEYHPIDINGENHYTCNKCSKKINIQVNIDTALDTTPVGDLNPEAVIKKAVEAAKSIPTTDGV